MCASGQLSFSVLLCIIYLGIRNAYSSCDTSSKRAKETCGIIFLKQWMQLVNIFVVYIIVQSYTKILKWDQNLSFCFAIFSIPSIWIQMQKKIILNVILTFNGTIFYWNHDQSGTFFMSQNKSRTKTWTLFTPKHLLSPQCNNFKIFTHQTEKQKCDGLEIQMAWGGFLRVNYH